MFYYRIISTGEVLGAGHSTSQPRDWVARYATALKLNPAEIEEFYSENDPRPAEPRVEPMPEPEERQPTEREGFAEAMLPMLEGLTELARAFGDNPAAQEAIGKLAESMDAMTQIVSGKRA